MAIQGDGKQTTERSDQVKASSLALSLLYSTQNLIHRLRNSLRIVLGVEPPTNSPRLDGNANPLRLSGDSSVGPSPRRMPGYFNFFSIYACFAESLRAVLSSKPISSKSSITDDTLLLLVISGFQFFTSGRSVDRKHSTYLSPLTAALAAAAGYWSSLRWEPLPPHAPSLLRATPLTRVDAAGYPAPLRLRWGRLLFSPSPTLLDSRNGFSGGGLPEGVCESGPLRAMHMCRRALVRALFIPPTGWNSCLRARCQSLSLAVPEHTPSPLCHL